MAEAIAERLKARHGGDRKSDQGGNISGLMEQGDTRDLAAAKAGLGSGKTLEAAKRVVEHGTPIIFPTEISSRLLRHHRLYGIHTPELYVHTPKGPHR